MKKKIIVLIVAVAFALLFRSVAGNMDAAKLERIRKNAADIDLVRIDDGKTVREYTTAAEVDRLVRRYFYGKEEKPSSSLTETGTISFYIGAHLVTKGKLYHDDEKTYVRIERVLMAVQEEDPDASR